jgi:hypothetical protein
MNKNDESVVIADAVGRVPLPQVKAQYLDGIFGNLTEVIEARITELRAEPSAGSAERVRFWEFVRDQLDPELHAKIQRKYLRKDATVRFSGLDRSPEGGLLRDIVKYIDPIV